MRIKNEQTQISNQKEFIQELIKKSKMVKKFHKELEEYRIKGDREGYGRKFKELMDKEERNTKWKKEYQRNN